MLYTEVLIFLLRAAWWRSFSPVDCGLIATQAFPEALSTTKYECWPMSNPESFIVWTIFFVIDSFSENSPLQQTYILHTVSSRWTSPSINSRGKHWTCSDFLPFWDCTWLSHQRKTLFWVSIFFAVLQVQLSSCASKWCRDFIGSRVGAT